MRPSAHAHELALGRAALSAAQRFGELGRERWEDGLDGEITPRAVDAGRERDDVPFADAAREQRGRTVLEGREHLPGVLGAVFDRAEQGQAIRACGAPAFATALVC